MHAGIPHLAKKIAAAGMACAALLAMPAGAVSITVKDPNGKPLPTVMVSRQPVKAAAVDTSDNGYPASGKPQQAYVELARFTDAQGQADIPAAEHPWKIRLRKPGYRDLSLLAADLGGKPIVMAAESDPAALADDELTAGRGLALICGMVTQLSYRNQGSEVIALIGCDQASDQVPSAPAGEGLGREA